MESAPQRIRLRLPEQDLHHLTLGSTNPKKMHEWVDALPMVNVGESSRLLYQALQELSRLQTDGKTRFQLLETVRPAVMLVCRQLGKHYLNQSVVLPEKARKVATLAQALQTLLATGYKLVAVDTVRRAKDKDTARIATVAMHRAATSMGDVLLRSHQLYLQTPKFHWLELHQLFLLAEGNGLDNVEVEDSEFRRVTSSTIRDTYIRSLLLSTSRPNQLRQQEIELAWDATEEWCGLVSVNQTRGTTDIFAFDLQADAPPTYRKLASQNPTEFLRSIDASALSRRLKLAADNGQLPEKNTEFSFPRGFSRELAMHLAQAWGNLTERAFQRISSSGRLEICVGLGATHFFLSGGIDFDLMVRSARMQVLHEEHENPFLAQQAKRAREQAQQHDPWSNAFDGGGFRMAAEGDFGGIGQDSVKRALAEQLAAQQPRVKFDSYQCDIVNASPGGYCIEWTGEMPGHVRTGELMGLREDGVSNWSIGVIRWIKQLAGKGAQLGVELLAPRAVPCGTRVIKQSGEMTEWMRTLVLPELRAIGQEATLVTPAIAFNTGYKVLLMQDGVQARVALYRQLNATPGFRQFLFRDLDKPLESSAPVAAAEPGGEDFDSIWSNL